MQELDYVGIYWYLLIFIDIYINKLHNVITTKNEQIKIAWKGWQSYWLEPLNIKEVT